MRSFIPGGVGRVSIGLSVGVVGNCLVSPRVIVVAPLPGQSCAFKLNAQIKQRIETYINFMALIREEMK